MNIRKRLVEKIPTSDSYDLDDRAEQGATTAQTGWD